MNGNFRRPRFVLTESVRMTGAVKLELNSRLVELARVHPRQDGGLHTDTSEEISLLLDYVEFLIGEAYRTGATEGTDD